MIKILIADDHSAIRKGVRYILSGEFTDIFFGDAVDTAETLLKIRNGNWDLVILDIDLPGRGGLEVLKCLKLEEIKTPILIFSFHKENQIAIRALSSGASGYLSKDSADTELLSAIKYILKGKKYISPTISELLLENLQTEEDKQLHETLSNREFEIFIHIASAKSLSQIADELSLSRPTISTYRSRILDKMKMRNNAEIMKYAIIKKLV